MHITIKPVTSKSEFLKFVKSARIIYKNDPLWVEPLIMDMKYNLQGSPFWEHAEKQLFIAYAANSQKPVGRIAAIIDHNYNDFHHEQTGFFGFFESDNDMNIAKALMNEAISWLKAKGMNKIMGPFSPSSNDVCGFLCEGFDSSPKLMMPYNPPYYLELMEDIGLMKCKQLYAYDIVAKSLNNLQVADKISKRVKKKLPSFKIRPVNIKDVNNEVNYAVSIYNQAWEKNWGFVPWTEDEFKSAVKHMKPLLVKDLVLFATVNDKPIGLIVALPDYNHVIKQMHGRILPFGAFKFLLNKKQIKNFRVMIMGVVKDYRLHGVDIALINQIIINGQKCGYNSGELSWILEDNHNVIKTIEWLGGNLYKTYQLYELPLANWHN